MTRSSLKEHRTRDASNPWTLLKLLRWATGYFTEKGIDNPRLDAERLLGYALGLDRVGVYLNHDRPLNTAELDRLLRLSEDILRYLIVRTDD